MTQQLTVEVYVKNGKNPQKFHFLKCSFLLQKSFYPKIKSKINILGKNCHPTFEVDVKNFTHEAAWRMKDETPTLFVQEAPNI